MMDRTRAVIYAECVCIYQWTAGVVKATTNTMRRERGTVKSETTNERKSTTTTKKEERNEANEEKKNSYVHHLGGYSKQV